MVDTLQDEIHRWVEAIAWLHDSVDREPGDMGAAREAVANLWSEFGQQYGPPTVVDMLIEAIEIGYVTALRDVREGDYDEDIRMWRPELSEQ